MCSQVRIVAGRPMHCQVPGIEYTMGKRAVQTMLEGATAIALSYNGILYIAETDEKKIHRIRQVISCFMTHMTSDALTTSKTVFCIYSDYLYLILKCV